jgi:hypothetical protein
MTRLTVYFLGLLLLASSPRAAVEKDLNLAVLKKAYYWLCQTTEEENANNQPVNETVDLSNVEQLWDQYKDIMRNSVVLIRKYPKKVLDKLDTLFTHENKDILPLITFYLYSVEKKDKTIRYYDAFKVIVAPANQENLWVALIPYTDSSSPKHSNYSILIMDLVSHRLISKD